MFLLCCCIAHSLSVHCRLMVLNEKYDDLIPGTRKQVYKWVEDIYTKSSGPFGMNTMDSSSGEGSKPNGGKDKGNRAANMD